MKKTFNQNIIMVDKKKMIIHHVFYAQ